jgi:hypothetical protein
MRKWPSQFSEDDFKEMPEGGLVDVYKYLRPPRASPHHRAVAAYENIQQKQQRLQHELHSVNERLEEKQGDAEIGSIMKPLSNWRSEEDIEAEEQARIELIDLIDRRRELIDHSDNLERLGKIAADKVARTKKEEEQLKASNASERDKRAATRNAKQAETEKQEIDDETKELQKELQSVNKQVLTKEQAREAKQQEREAKQQAKQQAREAAKQQRLQEKASIAAQKKAAKQQQQAATASHKVVTTALQRAVTTAAKEAIAASKAAAKAPPIQRRSARLAAAAASGADEENDNNTPPPAIVNRSEEAAQAIPVAAVDERNAMLDMFSPNRRKTYASYSNADLARELEELQKKSSAVAQSAASDLNVAQSAASDLNVAQSASADLSVVEPVAAAAPEKALAVPIVANLSVRAGVKRVALIAQALKRMDTKGLIEMATMRTALDMAKKELEDIQEKAKQADKGDYSSELRNARSNVIYFEAQLQAMKKA